MSSFRRLASGTTRGSCGCTGPPGCRSGSGSAARSGMSPPRAVADTVRGLTGLREVRAVVAGAVRRRACQVRDLAAELAAGPNTGSALFRAALGDVAEGIRSVAEADLKDLLARASIPVRLFNPALYARDGTFIARPDAWWPELGIAVEVDSREWHLSPEDHEKTLARGRRMGRYQII